MENIVSTEHHAEDSPKQKTSATGLKGNRLIRISWTILDFPDAKKSVTKSAKSVTSDLNFCRLRFTNACPTKFRKFGHNGNSSYFTNPYPNRIHNNWSNKNSQHLTNNFWSKPIVTISPILIKP